MKSPKKQPKQAQTAPRPALIGSELSLLEQTKSVLARGVSALDACVDRVGTLLAEEEEYDKGLASHMAWMTSHVAGLLEKFRKLEAHDRAMGKKLSPAEAEAQKRRGVVAVLRKLSPEERARLLSECGGLQ